MQVAKPKKGYKLVKTSFGKYEEIPEEWESVQIKDLSKDLISGGTPSTENEDYWNGSIPWIRSAWMTEKLISSGERTISDKGLEKSAANIVPKNNVIVATRVSLGNVAINKIDIAINQDLTGIILDKSKTTEDFFYWFLNKNSSELTILAQGSTIQGIVRNDLEKFKVLLPPLPEQKQIASILSNVDDTLQKTNQIIEQTQRLKKGMMQKLLTRGIGHKKFKKTQIGEISVEWNVSEIGKEFIVGSGATPKRERKEYYDGNIPWVKTTEIDYKLITSTEESITELGLKNSSVTKYPVGTLLVAMYGQGKTRGKCAILGIEATTNQACAGLQPKKNVNTKFIYYFLENSYEKIRIGQGSGQPNLTVGLVQKLVIPLPPLPEQQQIASILSNIDTQIGKEKLHKSNLERLKKGLMQKLLTGQIRVK